MKSRNGSDSRYAVMMITCGLTDRAQAAGAQAAGAPPTQVASDNQLAHKWNCTLLACARQLQALVRPLHPTWQRRERSRAYGLQRSGASLTRATSALSLVTYTNTSVTPALRNFR